MNNNSKEFVLQTLAEYLGIEPADIKDEDSLDSDLHMQPSDVSDFTEMLQGKNIDTTSLDLTAIETVNDLIEALGFEEI